MKNEIESYLQKKNIEYQFSNGEFILKTCPFCLDDRSHLYLSASLGLYHCKKCSSKGNFIQLQQHLGDIPDITSTHQPQYNLVDSNQLNKFNRQLLSSSSALKFLEKREINKDCIERFNLGYDDGWLVVPHYIEKKPVSIKYRKIEGKEFRRMKDTPSVLFNVDNLDHSKKYIIIVEGEFDAIKGTQERIPNIVATTLGAESFPYDWMKYLEPFETVYICFDSDEIGQKGARKTAEKIGLDKCKNIALPMKDLNDYLQVYNKKDFKELFDEARHFDIDEIKTLETCLEDFDEYLKDDKSLRGLSSGYLQLDSILRGFQNEDLIIISGSSTVGKTTFALNIMLSMLKEGKSILCFLLEGRMMYFVERLITIEAKKQVTELSKTELEKIKEQFQDYKLYFYTGPQGGLTVQTLINKTHQCKTIYDIDVLILDHLHKVVERGKDNYSALVGKSVSDLKNLAVDEKIPVIVITHIRKMARPDVVPTMQDLRDSSFAHQDPDVILMMWSNREDEEVKDNVLIKILKNKTGEDNVDIFYVFHRSSGFIEEKSI